MVTDGKINYFRPHFEQTNALNVLCLLGLVHTRHFDAQYCDKKIK